MNRQNTPLTQRHAKTNTTTRPKPTNIVMAALWGVLCGVWACLDRAYLERQQREWRSAK